MCGIPDLGGAKSRSGRGANAFKSHFYSLGHLCGDFSWLGDRIWPSEMCHLGPPARGESPVGGQLLRNLRLSVVDYCEMRAVNGQPAAKLGKISENQLWGICSFTLTSPLIRIWPGSQELWEVLLIHWSLTAGREIQAIELHRWP